MSGQLVCSGWGLEFMSWPTLLSFTNVTREPRGTTMSRGDTPAAVIVMVVVPPGDGPGDGDGDGDGDGEGDGSDGESPPQETTDRLAVMVSARAARLAA